MKFTNLLLFIVVCTGGVIRAADPIGSSSSTALTELVSGSHWAWYEGNFDRYKKGMPYWVEFYKDGTARVPWRDHPNIGSSRNPTS
jgi:hypothetical protein